MLCCYSTIPEWELYALQNILLVDKVQPLINDNMDKVNRDCWEISIVTICEAEYYKDLRGVAING